MRVLLLRLSISRTQSCNFTISNGFDYVQAIVPVLWNLKLHYGSKSKPYHSINLPRASDSSSLPRWDHSINRDVARANLKITRLSKDGEIAEARKLFDEMPDPDVITWSAVISGYIKCGMIHEARKLFERDDCKKNVVTWTGMVSGYIQTNRIFEAEKLFDEMPHRNVVSWNTMISGYIQCNQIDNALALFDKMPERNVVSWNTILTGLAQKGRIDEAKNLFDKMPQRDVISWTAIVTGLSNNGRVDEARLLFDAMPERNIVSWNAMITGYCQNLMYEEAFNLFKKMKEKDIPSWNAMITGFIQNKNVKKAQTLFDEMPKRNVVSWTAMINGYVEDNQCEEALNMFIKMKSDNKAKPNEGTYVGVLCACSSLAALREGTQIHQVISKSVYQNSPNLVSALINMYSKSGELLTARKMFDHGLKGDNDLVSWNCIITAYAHHGFGREAINLFEKMREMGFKPNDVTYIGLLSACSHGGLVEEGLKFFNELIRDKSIQVREDHYTCLVDLCGRAGRLKEAFDFIDSLPSKPSSSVWLALLSGCTLHGNSEMGKVVANKALEVESDENASGYMLLSNVLASCGEWREVANMRAEMKEKGLKKQPGCSWIEVGNRFHVFVVGDKSKGEDFKVIYDLLGDLHAKMRKDCYILNEDFIQNL